MLSVAVFISFGMVARSMGLSDLSLNSLLRLSPPQYAFGHPSSANSSLSDFCPSSAYHSKVVRSSTTNALVYKYEQVAPVGPGVDIGHGFFQHACFPDPNATSEDEREQLCLFLNPTINQGLGMVVVSKPSTLYESLESQLDLTNEAEKPVAFRVVEMPEKGGMGAIASRHLQAGDLVINSRATLMVTVEDETYDRPDWKHIRKLAADLLPLESRAGLARLFGSGETEEDWISSAIDMNSFEISLGKDSDVPFFAVFLTPSRLNHDCRPNTAFHVDSESLEIHMHALRVITPGEELTISYRDMSQIREKRQEDIAHYGFKCTCAHCSMSDAQADESDRRLIRIEELSNKLVEWSGESTGEDMLDEVEELVELYLLEGLDNNIADGYTIAAVTYNSFGQTDRASQYATQALSSGLTNFGAKWEESGPLHELVENPEQHWSYRARIPQPTINPEVEA